MIDIQRTETEYDSLPEPIKAIYSPKEFAWLSDAQKKNIELSECIPDATID